MDIYKNIQSIGNRKVAIIGAGYVGSSIAYALALKHIAREIVLIDIDCSKTKGEAEDIRHGIPSMGSSDLYAGSYKDCKDCDLIIITAGRGRKPGETRLDLAKENTRIMSNVVLSIKRYYTHGVIMVVSNPVDILTFKCAQWMGLTHGTVFGTGCMLDTSRLVRTIADYLQISTGVINGHVIGEHGDRQIPVWSNVTVAGIPISEYCEDVGIEWNEDVRLKLAVKTRDMGSDIIKSKGRTHYGIATCVCHLADAILNQRPIIESVTAPIEWEENNPVYALSVPSVVGPGGIVQRVREKWNMSEYEEFSIARDKMLQVLRQVED